MNINRIFIFSLMITLSSFSCQEEFLLVTKDHNSILVVDGIITNEPGPYTVKLSLSSQVNDTKIIPYSACKLTIFDDTGISEVLTESEPGVYSTSEMGIQGKIGNKYRIKIVTPDDNEYETVFQEIKEPVEIDTIYAELIKNRLLDYPFGLSGYQFYTDTEKALSQDNYILWNMIETFQYTADYHLFAIFDGHRFLINGADTITEYENLYRCWKTQKVNTIYTGKMSNLTIPKIHRQPLCFVGTDTRRLQERYSLLLKQYTIDKEAYYFWKAIEDQISQENFLIATQPFNILGNVKNNNNPEEQVYGYFTVGSVVEKRVFKNNPFVAFYYEICYIATESTRPPPIYYVRPDDGTTGMVFESCLDCRSKGGDTIKPDFWIAY